MASFHKLFGGRKARSSARLDSRYQLSSWSYVSLERRDLLAAGWVDFPDQDAARQLRETVSPGTQTLFYDYLEQGELKGGRLALSGQTPGDKNQLGRSPISQQGWNVEPLFSSGPSSNRIDLVFVGDGYTSGELAAYANQVNNTLPVFFSRAPLDAYKSFFNIHRVDVISNQSGVDNDPTQGIQRDTALDMGYWGYGIERLLIVSTQKAANAAASAPGVDQILALANSSKYGGAGYSASNLGTYAGGNGSAIEIALHEFGHSFADLADEYDYADGSTHTGGEFGEPNVSNKNAAQIQSSQTKWHRWLDLPEVDSFEGAAYKQFRAYRPTSNSLMRSLGRPLDAVNVEQFVVSAYKTVRPIDTATAPGTYSHSQVFAVDPVDPVSHPLSVQWYLDGLPISGATGTSFSPATLGLSGGTYSLSVRVVDETPLVRDPQLRNTWLTETRAWTVKVEPNLPPVIASFRGAVSYVENALPRRLTTTATVTDTDSPNFGSGRMEVRLVSGAEASDRLTLQSTSSMVVNASQVLFQGQVVATWSGGVGTSPLVLELTTRATPARVETILRNVMYQNVSDAPSANTRQVSVNLSDGDGGNAAGVQKAINVIAVNDRPTLAGISGSVSYLQNAGGVLIASGATVADPDNPNFSGGVLTVRVGAGRDLSNRLIVSGNFSFDAGNNLVRAGVIIGSRNGSGGIGLTDLAITFNSQASRAIVEELLRTIRFRTYNGTSFQQRRIDFTLTDGKGGTSNTLSRLVNVT